ncbi:MAG: hypothetical protein JWM86_1919, partial [Thermoleophilia bacterium]|nr:hypothetical protein [Thermoleophilia bacterium]
TPKPAELRRGQDGLDARARDARERVKPGGIDPAYDREQAEIRVRAAYWKRHDSYVGESGKVYRVEDFNDINGDLTVTSTKQVDNRPSKAELAAARAGQRRLDGRIDNRVEGLPATAQDDPGARARIERNQQAIYYATHPIKVEDGNVYSATVDPQSGHVAFELQPDRLTVTETHVISLDGSQESTYEVEGELPDNRGRSSSTRTERTNANGRIIGGSSRSEYDDFGDGPGADSISREEATTFGRGGRLITRDVRLGLYSQGARSELSTAENYDAKGRLARSVTQRHDERDGPQQGSDVDETIEVTDSTTTLSYEQGVIARSRSEATTTNTAFPNEPVESVTATDVSFDQQGRPIGSVVDQTVTEQDIANHETTTDVAHTTRSNGGAPIYRPDGTPAVDPVGTLTRTYRKVVPDGGQDDGHDFEQSLVLQGSLDPTTGAYAFSDTADGTTVSRGKDGDITHSYDLRVDPKTGATSGEPFNDMEHDDRSGWRKVQDGVTTVAKWAGAVAGAGLLVATTVGTGGLGTPAAWAAATAAFNTVVLGSTVFDATTGRNHAGFSDAALAAVGTLPGLGSGVAWAGKKAVTRALSSGVDDAVRGARLAAAGDRFGAAGKLLIKPAAVGNATFAGVQLENVRSKVARGEPLTPLDVALLLAAGGRGNFSRGKLNGTIA